MASAGLSKPAASQPGLTVIRRKRRRDEAPEDLLWIAPDAAHIDKKAGVGGASATQPIAFRRVSTGPLAAAFDHAAYTGRLAKQLRESRTSGIVRVAVENGESVGLKAHDSVAAVQQHGRLSVSQAASKTKASRRRAARQRIQKDRMLRFVDIDSSGNMQHPSASLPLRTPYVAVKGRILNAMERQMDQTLWAASTSGVFDDLMMLLAQSPTFINFQRALADGSTALMAAAHHNHAQFAKWLLRGGAEPRLSDAHGRTALHYAAAAGHRELAGTLECAEQRADAENPVAGVSSPLQPGDAFEYDVYVSASATGHAGEFSGDAAAHGSAAAAAAHVRLPADMLGRFDMDPTAGEMGDSETAESFEEYLQRLAREEHEAGGVAGWDGSDEDSDSEDSNREDAPNTDYPEEEDAAEDEHWLHGEKHDDGYGYGVETVDDGQAAAACGRSKGNANVGWARQTSGYDGGEEDVAGDDSGDDVNSWGVGGKTVATDALDAEDAAIGADQESALDAAPGETEEARQARVMASIEAAHAASSTGLFGGGSSGAAIVPPASLGMHHAMQGGYPSSGGGLLAGLRAPAAGSEAGRRITHEQFAREVLQQSRGGAASIGALSRGPGLDGLAGYVEPDDEAAHMGRGAYTGILAGDIDPLSALPPGVAAQIRAAHGSSALPATGAASDSDTDL